MKLHPAPQTIQILNGVKRTNFRLYEILRFRLNFEHLNLTGRSRGPGLAWISRNFSPDYIPLAFFSTGQSLCLWAHEQWLLSHNSPLPWWFPSFTLLEVCDFKCLYSKFCVYSTLLFGGVDVINQKRRLLDKGRWWLQELEEEMVRVK